MADETKRLNELQVLKTRFLASLNHEIRTPLSGILGMTDLLLETNLDDAQQDYVATVRLCAEELLEVLNTALELSAAVAGGLPLDESEFNLSETLKGAVDQHRARAHTRGLKLTVTLDESLPAAVIGDALRLRQVLAQLISNAIKFTPEGAVDVTASAAPLPDGRCLLTVKVRDTGIGIEPDRLADLFQCFGQLESGLERRYPGLGLGLALVQQLVGLMGGTVGVQSELGKGSEFSISIPLRVVAEAPAPAPPKAPVQTEVRRARILLVEDDAVARRVVAHMLRRAQYDVDSVGSGPAAIAAAREQVYDLVLMDLQMPGLDGIETAQLLQKLPGYARVPIVAVTAHTSEEHRAFCLDEGFQGFLSKPVRSEELLVIVAQSLGRDAVADEVPQG